MLPPALLEIPYHNIDPTAFTLGVSVKWYGIGYVVTFLIAYLVLRSQTKRGHLPLTGDDVTSFLMYAMFGTLLGGRLGEMLFYTDYFTSFRFLSHPLEFFGYVNGQFRGIRGLAFHGGLMGVLAGGAIFVWVRNRWSWRALDPAIRDVEGKRGYWQRYRALYLRIFDACVLVAPGGIFLVRMMNFVNGELYGRIIRDADGNPITDAADAPAWAMRFPTSPEGVNALASHYRAEEMTKWIGSSSDGRGGLSMAEYSRQFVEPKVEALASRLPVDPEVWDQVSSSVPLRHPSQVYQAICEGLLVLVAVWVLRNRMPKAGMLSGVFLLGYALGRVPMELFREPDPVFEAGRELGGWGQILDAMSMTQGQFLSLVMGLAGATLIVLCARSKNPHMVRGMTSGPVTTST